MALAVDEVPSVSDATQEPANEQLIAAAVKDFLNVLSDLNHELNGPVPSASRVGATEISREVVYAVAEVARMLGAGAPTPERADALWAVETAWRAVLAGDIDDLHQHVIEEGLARG